VLRKGDDYEAWSVLGLALSLLGHYRAAAHAHRAALALEPGCPIAAHNLGHLLDVGLGQPARALHHLERAYRARPHDEEIAGSYAHALARVGRREEAVTLLGAHLSGGMLEAERRVARWLAG
jgi:Flp pilus assembly protein TadD